MKSPLRKLGILLILAGAMNGWSATFNDSLTSGINTTNWAIRTNTGYFTISATSAGVTFSKGSGMISNLQSALLASKLVAQGNFSVMVDFTNAVIQKTNGTTGNQIQLNTRFGSQDLLMVRSSEVAFGQNAHVYPIPPGVSTGVVTWTTNHGTLRVTRTGTQVTAYIDAQQIYQNNYNTNAATFSFNLQNLQTSDPITNTFRNFQLTADRLDPLTAQITERNGASNSVVLSWKDTSWPDTLQGYVVQATTNLSKAASWQPVAYLSTPVTNQFALTNNALGQQRFYRLKQGPDSYN